MAKKLDDRLNQALSDDAFEELLKASLKPVEPPCDFSSRVMNAIATEQPAQASPKLIRFPFRRFALGAASCAAALLLFVAVAAPSADQPAVPAAKPLQIAEQPLFTAPEPDKAEQSVQTPETTASREPDTTNTSDAPVMQTPAADIMTTPEQTEPTPVSDQEPPAEVQDGELILPRTAYGIEMKDSLATRLVAEVENSHIYQPGFADKNAVFYTADNVNVYSWRVDLANAGEPQASVQAAKSDLPGVTQLLTSTTAPVDSTTLVTSPDSTMLAQNSTAGVWISLLDGDVFQLTSESGGNILAWSPDSSKLLFTNNEGNLFLGYPLEQRIYQISDQNVKDVCWSTDNKTLLYVAGNDTQDALYIVTVY